MALSEYLLELFLSRADQLAKDLEAARSIAESLKELVEGLWAARTPKAPGPHGVSAVDGGSNFLELKWQALYAVVGYGMEGDGAREHWIGDVGLLSVQDVADFVRTLREICELKAALSLRARPIIIDGSVTPLLVDPSPLARRATLAEAFKITAKVLGEEAVDEVWRGLQEQRRRLRDSARFLGEPFIARALVRNTREGADVVFPFLLLVERLLALRMLLEEAGTEAGDVPGVAFLSKSSRGRQYCERIDACRAHPLLSDSTVFELATRRSGYSSPVRVPEEGVIKAMPREGALGELVRDFFEEVGIYASYVRLIDDGPVLRLELAVRGGGPKDVARSIEALMDVLAGSSYEGYPYPLIVADRKARVERDALLRLAWSLGSVVPMTGREVLGEWLRMPEGA
ncbi:MAG: DNA double-strand break repair nuclease NurA [Desulfurococcaceae archaeon]